jgi:hypothetical protein
MHKPNRFLETDQITNEQPSDERLSPIGSVVMVENTEASQPKA